jgi:hypothetical protein
MFITVWSHCCAMFRPWLLAGCVLGCTTVQAQPVELGIPANVAAPQMQAAAQNSDYPRLRPTASSRLSTLSGSCGPIAQAVCIKEQCCSTDNYCGWTVNHCATKECQEGWGVCGPGESICKLVSRCVARGCSQQGFSRHAFPAQLD